MLHLTQALRRLSAVCVAAALCAVALLSAPAYADGDAGTEADAAGSEFLNGNHVYVSQDAAQNVDAATLQDEIGDDSIYIAVVPPNTPPSDVVMQLANTLQQEMTVVVVSGSEFSARSSAICSDQAQPLLDDSAAEHEDERASGELTSWLQDYIGAVQDAPASGDSACEGGAASSGGGLGSSLLWIFGALLVGAGGGYLWLRRQKSKKAEQMESAAAGIRELTDQLGREIEATDVAGNELAGSALLDARERHHAAIDAIEHAVDVEDLDAAQLAATEGLTAVRYARQAQGARAGFDIPALPKPEGEQLAHEQEFAVGNQRAIGVPNYAPGAPFFHPGGDEIPGGWYSSPIWDSVLIDSIIDEDEERDDAVWDDRPEQR